MLRRNLPVLKASSFVKSCNSGCLGGGPCEGREMQCPCKTPVSSLHCMGEAGRSDAAATPALFSGHTAGPRGIHRQERSVVGCAEYCVLPEQYPAVCKYMCSTLRGSLGWEGRGAAGSECRDRGYLARKHSGRGMD